MRAFEYTALDTAGHEQHGVLEGDSARQVRQLLRGRGLMPLDVAEITAQHSHRQRQRLAFGRRISYADLALATRQLSTLTHAGIPIEQALNDVARQTRNRHLNHVLHAVRARVNEGRSMAAGLAEFPDVFPELYHTTVEAGEKSGYLDVVLERLADHSERQYSMRQKVTLALFYPMLLTLVAVLVVIGLLTNVVPRVVSVFEGIGQELPLITRSLIAASEFLASYGIVLFGLLVAATLAIRALLRQPGPRQEWHRLILRMPVIGNMSRAINAARFSRTLSILVASSVPILEALRISSQVLNNVEMRAAVERAATRVREGSSLRMALERTGYFPPMILSLVASGESSGDLEGMLERAAATQERELEAVMSTVLGLFEPLLILFMGGIVLLIVLAILLPIFELNELVALANDFSNLV